MSYLTMEVEIDHGKVVTKEPSKLPEKACGLLTIFQPEASETSKFTPLQALDALQKYLRLDAARAAEWMTTVREARRQTREMIQRMIHFDTNFLIQTPVAGSSAHERFRSQASAQENFNVSSVAWAEFLCGPLDATAESIARQIFPSPEPLLSVDASLAAKLFNQTGRRSRSLADCMIAAVAIRCGAKLATINSADFQPFVQHGLVLA